MGIRVASLTWITKDGRGTDSSPNDLVTTGRFAPESLIEAERGEDATAHIIHESAGLGAPPQEEASLEGETLGDRLSFQNVSPTNDERRSPLSSDVGGQVSPNEHARTTAPPRTSDDSGSTAA